MQTSACKITLFYLIFHVEGTKLHYQDIFIISNSAIIIMRAVAWYNANNYAMNFMYVDCNKRDFNVQFLADEFFLNIRILYMK